MVIKLTLEQTKISIVGTTSEPCEYLHKTIEIFAMFIMDDSMRSMDILGILLFSEHMRVMHIICT